MSRLALRAVLALGYPLMMLLAWRGVAPRYLGCLLILLLWLRRGSARGPVGAALQRLTRLDWMVAAMLGGLSVAIAASNSETLLHLYPFCVSIGLLVAFGASLLDGPSMIEKFARLRHPDPGPGIRRYTRRVTQVWCGFFVLNGLFSLYTALYWDRAAWSLYNGLIVYGLIGALLAGEWLWRQAVVMPRQARSGTA
ncbi:hypothetical protein F3J16_26175 [Burkholderia sp. Ap-962]|uniref:COG4648 family protein n=1 Tax=Burkholderia sp. Ap-962 TaxID=2608333 RepID=UPI0014207D32|nr:hypothetical protein [Burkholderia sp. Ap-962]NIF73643.1 hypothetical protein [Burkholderia sp. Ap-962]